MNLHEFQAKQLFSEYGIPVPINKPVNPYTKGHSVRVGEMAKLFGEYLGLSDKIRNP